MSNRRPGSFGNNNRGGNRGYGNNHGNMAVQNRGVGGMGFGQQQGNWRQQNMSNQGRQGGGPQGMNNFDNRQFHQQQQQQQMMNQQNNQFANQLSNAVLRSGSVGPNPGMMSFGGNQDQQHVVMVLPQSQATGGMMGGGNMGNMGGGGMGNMGGGGMGNMGGNMGNQNPFAMNMNQQKPMQVIVGNLPGLNPAAFGQQVLPAYGQGVGEQNMGMFGQQNQQGANRFGRDIKNPSDRGRNMNQRMQKTLVRRNEANDRGRLAAPRGVAKKRGLPIAGHVDVKKARTAGLVVRNNLNNRMGLAQRRGLKNRKAKVQAGTKPAAKTEKKEGEKAADEEKPTENGEAAEGESKEGAEAEVDANGEKKPSKFDEIPVEFLVCKVCQKAMSDAQSYESHLTGKAHVNLMKILEEKFGKRAELLMTESKMCEEEIAVEKDRQRRQGKGARGMKANQNHCKMCDCTYTVNWGAHKASVWHKVLKEFLHPTCRFCKTQFVHRKDWVEHILSVGHMKKLIALKAEGKVSVTEQENTTQEELFAVHIEMTREEKPLNIVNIHYVGGKQPLTDDVKEMLQGENGQVVLPEGDIQIPTEFDENVAVGEDAIFNVGGSCCKVCKFYVPETLVENHCKTRQHFDSYVEYLKRVVKLRENKIAQEKKAQEEAEKKAKVEAEAAVKAAEAEAKAAEAEKVKAEAVASTPAAPEVKPAAAVVTPTKAAEPEKMEVEQTTTAAPTTSPPKTSPTKPVETKAPVQEVAKPAEEEKMEEDVPAVAPPAASPTKEETPKPAATPNSTPTPKTPQRGAQNNNRGRGSPARGRGGAPNNRGGGGGGGGGFRGGRGGQTPTRGNATPGNMRGGRGGQARGGNAGGRGGRGSPRGRGRGGW